MKNTKKLISLLGIAFITASVFTGCSSSTSGSSNDNITLTWETHRTDMANTKLKDLADKYHKENPNIKISIESVKDGDNVMKTRAAAGELPDLSDIPADMKRIDLPLYYAPIDDLGFTKSNIFGYDIGAIDGKLYGLNSSVNYCGIIYNKKSFKEAGIETVPKTMDEFYADCKKLKDKGMIPFASNYKDKWPLNVYSQDMVLEVEQTANANFKNDLKNKKLFGDKDGMLYAYDFLRGMNEKGFLEPDLMSTNWDSMKKDQATGKTAMTFLGSWYPTQVVENGADKNDIGMFPFPGTKKLLVSPDYMFGISKNSKHIKETKDFLKWLYKDDKFENAINIASPRKGVKYTDPALTELMSYNTPTIEAVVTTTEVDKLFKRSQIDFQASIQEYVTAKDPQSVIDKYNKMWDSAKESN
ncbi:ABC transporter substrate-binding protein [Clostridium felsineum]|uniref:Uncharacterized protein n=1 Tax=Clostridium felsineum TaxID=36839 RepID=A0A1S8LSB9_9CLOT|nr:extracellular solute-binding protein [Clostridium felsineum]MCR3761473.1 extracellular solute-binding protein [Clostridium felsineum]URZ02484.1 hypothetical protein CLAUR_024900 [Clostridium felsineum]URZ04778.1 hypothetical protein CLROS_000930 [Clostridium felsineum]URZ09819.1 hypothetical protein CROST_005180 [Clostridium felsineum]